MLRLSMEDFTIAMTEKKSNNKKKTKQNKKNKTKKKNAKTFQTGFEPITFLLPFEGFAPCVTQRQMGHQFSIINIQDKFSGIKLRAILGSLHRMCNVQTKLYTSIPLLVLRSFLHTQQMQEFPNVLHVPRYNDKKK